MASLIDRLIFFTNEKRFKGKGPLAVALVVTQHARKKGLPLNPEELITDGGGQVLGLGRNAVQAILLRYGISKVLAAEGGRTSRGSLLNMREYVALLNLFHANGLADLDQIELFWIEQVKAFFAGKPFKLQLDASKSLRTVVRNIIKQAEDRQKSSPGMYYAGAVLQHLVGAKLDCALGLGTLNHNSFSTSDEQSGRHGDFFLEDVSIHVTTSPGEALIQKCLDNINNGLRPMIVTLQNKIAVAEGIAENFLISDRIDIFEIVQFIALNLYELGRFKSQGRRIAVRELVEHYNNIIDIVETDPSLKIEIQ